MFGKKKVKKTPEELKREREEHIQKVQGELQLQIVALGKKKDLMFSKVIEARQKALPAQERQARGLLKQTMAAYKRAEGMLMTLELAVQSRDLAELNINFLRSIGELSDDIIASGKESANIKAVEDKYLRAMYETEKQAEKIDSMIAVGEYATAASVGTDSYNEFDSEIDLMLEDAGFEAAPPAANRLRDTE